MIRKTNRELTLEQRIDKLEQLITDNSRSRLEARARWSSFVITKSVADELARAVKEYLQGENAGVSAKLIKRNTDGRAEIRVVLDGEDHRYYFTSDLSGHYAVYVYDNGHLVDELGRFDDLDDAAEAIADNAYGLY